MLYQQFTNDFQFDLSYLKLPDLFYSRVTPTPVYDPQCIKLNTDLMEALNLTPSQADPLIHILAGNRIPESTTTIAQAYAGHQFGHFNMLGDGRAILLGEHLTQKQQRYDIQLKGSGQTPYSRRGDGRATLKAMLREYLISEAMHHLQIPTSRSLAVVKTGESVYREQVQEGAVLTRVMKSHLRVGTFEFASYFGTKEDLLMLTEYTLNRHFPMHISSDQAGLRLLEEVMQLQIQLVVHWMRVGFIHGVMNTDNTSISGETFDYGPCAFMNRYHPNTVFSSIDSNGRYAFGNQPRIIKWNLTRLAEALLPIIHEDKDTAVQIAQRTIDAFDALWDKEYRRMMLGKIGIAQEQPNDLQLVDELLQCMQLENADYTNTFAALSEDIEWDVHPLNTPSLKNWFEKWKQRVTQNEEGLATARIIMKQYNPVFIPRNHLVEQALDLATQGNFSLFDQLLTCLKTPYQYQDSYRSFLFPPNEEFELQYQTFCGT